MKKTIITLLLALGITGAAFAQEFTCQIKNEDGSEASYARLTSKSYKVEGNPDIENFFLAIAPGLNRGFEDIKQLKQDIKNSDCCTLDKKNGYFCYGDEGAGSLHIQACYWNTKSKQKMLAVYYDEHDFDYTPGSDMSKIINTSYLAFFLYDENTKTLESIEAPMREPLEMPKAEEQETKAKSADGDNTPVTPIHFICQLPQHGKDIKYFFGREDDIEKNPWKTLKYNGLLFE